METNKKLNMKKTVPLIFVVILPILFIDPVGLTPLLSALSLTYLFDSNSTSDFSLQISNKRKRFSLILALVSSAVAYVIYYLIATGGLNRGIIFNNEIILLPTYAMLLIYLTPIVWFFTQRNNKSQTKKAVDKNLIKLTALICVVFINHSLARLSVYINQYSNVTINECLHMIVQAFFVAAIAEELFFRGYIYSLLKESFSIRNAQIISSLIFTFSHFNLLLKALNHFDIHIVFNYIAIFSLGMVTTIIYENKKSLMPCIFLHGAIDGGFKYLIILVMNLL